MKKQRHAMYVKIGEAADRLCVCRETLRNWVKEGRVGCKKSKGGHRLFNIVQREDKWIIGIETEEEIEEILPKARANVVYCRVSTPKQREDLTRQEIFARENYPNYEIIKDIGSGLNWKRKGLLKLLSRCRNGEIEKVIVIHRDRLCRFGFELLETILRLDGVELLVHQEEIEKSQEQQLAEDILSIIHVFSCRRNGQRKYKNKVTSDQSSGEAI